MLHAFKIIGFMGNEVLIENDLDHALEKCEDEIIEVHREAAGKQETLIEWLSVALEDHGLAGQLSDLCKRIEVSEGDVIARQGAASDSMHFVLDGRVGIVVDVGEGRSVRVRSLGKHTTIGEMGLLTRRPRSANIVAETPSVLYELSAESYERLKDDNPTLSQALLTFVIKVMGERLSFANQAIGILQR
jgi:SulP family sulfate permease